MKNMHKKIIISLIVLGIIIILTGIMYENRSKLINKVKLFAVEKVKKDWSKVSTSH